MLDHSARTQAWHADLAAIIIDLDRAPPPRPRPASKRTRKLKPLWEE